jgi:hypothetical protein
MKRTVPFLVRVVSLLTAAGITSLIIGVHAVDLTVLSSPDPVANSAKVAASGGFDHRLVLAKTRAQ